MNGYPPHLFIPSFTNIQVVTFGKVSQFLPLAFNPGYNGERKERKAVVIRGTIRQASGCEFQLAHLLSSPLPPTVTPSLPGVPLPPEESLMEYEFITVLLCAVLPVYPALFVIYQRIGKYDVMCEELEKLQEEHDRVHSGKDVHGS